MKRHGLFKWMVFSIFVHLLLHIGSVAKADIATGRSYEDVTRYLQKLEHDFPQNVKGFTLGTSDAGLPIFGLRIGNGRVNNLVVGTHHGNEFPSTEVVLNFAESVAKSPIAGQTLFIIPVLNIDGYNRRDRYENVRGRYLDLNRDYPGPCGTEGPFQSRSTKALADFIDAQNIVTTATIHTYKPAVVYPWGVSTEDVETPYTSFFEKLAQAATVASRYEIGYSTIVMYPADGTYEDYVFWKHGIYSLLFEVGGSNQPSRRELEFSVNSNVAGLREMMLHAPVTRAPNHQFAGRCSPNFLDLHLE